VLVVRKIFQQTSEIAALSINTSSEDKKVGLEKA